MTIHASKCDWSIVAFGLVAALVATLGVTRYQIDWKDKYFTANALMYGIPQLCVLVVLLPFRPPAVSVAGVLLLNASYLVLFYAWVFSQPRPDGGVWLICGAAGGL
jgi:hypothetical protein